MTAEEAWKKTFYNFPMREVDSHVNKVNKSIFTEGFNASQFKVEERKSDAVEFAEWLKNNGYKPSVTNPNVWAQNHILISTEKVYELFLNREGEQK